MIQTVVSSCPYCGENIELVIDCSVGSQRYVEDCFVCCQPITVVVDIDFDNDVSVNTLHQDDC